MSEELSGLQADIPKVSPSPCYSVYLTMRSHGNRSNCWLQLPLLQSICIIAEWLLSRRKPKARFGKVQKIEENRGGRLKSDFGSY